MQEAPEWDGRTVQLKVVDASERTMKLRALVSARASGPAFDLGCKVREALFALLAREYPQHLPNQRQINTVADQQASSAGAVAGPPCGVGIGRTSRPSGIQQQR